MKVHRQTDFILQRLDQCVGRRRQAQAGHVLDADDVRTGRLETVRQLQVVLQVVLGVLRIVQVAGVAQRRLAQLVGLEHRVDGDAHVLEPVE